MRLNEDILRYMSIAVDELETEPSALMQSKSPRRFEDDFDEDRPRRPRKDFKEENEETAAEGNKPTDDADKKGEV